MGNLLIQQLTSTTLQASSFLYFLRLQKKTYYIYIDPDNLALGSFPLEYDEVYSLPY